MVDFQTSEKSEKLGVGSRLMATIALLKSQTRVRNIDKRTAIKIVVEEPRETNRCKLQDSGWRPRVG